jgi:PAS domain S-box-containing protein
MTRRVSRRTQGHKSRRQANGGDGNARTKKLVTRANGKRVPQNGNSRGDAAPLSSVSPAVVEWLKMPGSSRALMDLAHDAIIIRDAAGRIVSWNASATELYGYSAEEAMGNITHSLLHTKFPASAAAVQETLLRQGYWEGQLEHRCKDGSHVLVESRHSLLRDIHGQPLLIKEINRDITQQQRQLEYLRLLTEVSGAVTQAVSMDEALRWILASICLHTHWCAARACRMDVETGKEIENTAIWFLNDEKRLAQFRAATDAEPRLRHQKRLSERVIKKSEPVWIPMIAKDPYFAALAEAGIAGLYCAYGLAVPFGKDAAIAIGLFSQAPLQVDEAFHGVMQGIVGHLSRLSVRLRAEETQRNLSLSLMLAQDAERRRIARELHDSTGQYLSALALTIDAACSHENALPPAAMRKLKDAQEMIQRCSGELRTLSHLLHPPLLDELGLASAMNWYIDGFGERSGIKVQAEIPAQLPRFEHGAELTVFRILQECLTNIHRHSGSKTAFVKLECAEASDGGAASEWLILEVRDEGKGIRQETLSGWFGNKTRTGVGISGMRERVRDLDGTLHIESTGAGTIVRAAIPFRAEASRRDAVGTATAANGANRGAPTVLRPSGRAGRHEAAAGDRGAPV